MFSVNDGREARAVLSANQRRGLGQKGGAERSDVEDVRSFQLLAELPHHHSLFFLLLGGCVSKHTTFFTYKDA